MQELLREKRLQMTSGTDAAVTINFIPQHLEALCASARWLNAFKVKGGYAKAHEYMEKRLYFEQNVLGIPESAVGVRRPCYASVVLSHDFLGGGFVEEIHILVRCG